MTGRLLAIDPGTKRMGYAISDEMGVLARPLEVWKKKGREADLQHLLELIESYEVQVLVIGVPYRLDGSESHMTLKAKAFVEEIRAALPQMEIMERDEALTTWQAEEILREKGVSLSKKKTLVDAYAAAVLLQEVLEERGARLS